jgi:molybdate transport system substrate-binding protein
MSKQRILAVTLALAVNVGIAAADEAQVAVAANFSAPAKQLAAQFEKATGHKLALSTGSTGKFYSQISNGAPFDVLLAADSETPRRMEQEKLAVSGSRFTYALGKLALWSPKAGVVHGNDEVLRTGTFRRISIANPRLAPYGAAAQQAMERLGAWATLQDRLVMGENVAQAFQFVATGNAELGFVAYSQVREPGKPLAGSFWLVPQSLYAPLRQDAVLLAHGASNAAAREFLAFLRSAPALELIRGYGYELP